MKESKIVEKGTKQELLNQMVNINPCMKNNLWR